jgi:hypothetical protein
MFAHVAVSPDPVSTKPAVHEHEYEPTELVHRFAGVMSRPHAVAGVHSLMSMHVAVAPEPDAMKPAAQAHV